MRSQPLNRRSMLHLGAADGAIAGAVGTLPLILPAGSAAPVSPHADRLAAVAGGQPARCQSSRSQS